MPSNPNSADDLPDRLSAPARRALQAAGINDLRTLASWSARDVRRLHGIGPMAMLQLDKALKDRGLGFK